MCFGFLRGVWVGEFHLIEQSRCLDGRVLVRLRGCTGWFGVGSPNVTTGDTCAPTNGQATCTPFLERYEDLCTVAVELHVSAIDGISGVWECRTYITQTRRLSPPWRNRNQFAIKRSNYGVDRTAGYIPKKRGGRREFRYGAFFIVPGTIPNRVIVQQKQCGQSEVARGQLGWRA